MTSHRTGGTRGRAGWLVLALLGVVGGAWIAACSLNPQPIPPGAGPDAQAGVPGGGSEDGGGFDNRDSGIGPIGNDAGDAGPGDGGQDAGDAGPGDGGQDAGDGDAGDGEQDGGDIDAGDAW